MLLPIQNLCSVKLSSRWNITATKPLSFPISCFIICPKLMFQSIRKSVLISFSLSAPEPSWIGLGTVERRQQFHLPLSFAHFFPFSCHPAPCSWEKRNRAGSAETFEIFASPESFERGNGWGKKGRRETFRLAMSAFFRSFSFQDSRMGVGNFGIWP